MTRDEEILALCAIRYTIGRMSYVVSDGQRWALEWGAKSKWVRDVIIRDLAWEIGREDDYYIPEGKDISGLGCVYSDSLGWREVYRQLVAMREADNAS
jgi:hypothetical protein